MKYLDDQNISHFDPKITRKHFNCEAANRDSYSSSIDKKTLDHESRRHRSDIYVLD